MEKGSQVKLGEEKQQVKTLKKKKEREKRRRKKLHLICSPSARRVGSGRMQSVSLFLKDRPLYTERRGLLAHSKL